MVVEQVYFFYFNTQITKGDMLDGTFGTLKVLVCIDNECEIRLFKNINLLRELIHPNIVDMEGYSALQKPVFLVLENMTGIIELFWGFFGVFFCFLVFFCFHNKQHFMNSKYFLPKYSFIK